MKAMNKICGNSRGPPAVKRLSHDVFVLFIRILLTLNMKRWQEFLSFFNLFFQATTDPPVSGQPLFKEGCSLIGGRFWKFVCNELPSKIMFAGGTENNSSFSFETLSENSIS